MSEPMPADDRKRLEAWIENALSGAVISPLTHPSPKPSPEPQGYEPSPHWFRCWPFQWLKTGGGEAIFSRS